ncbi:MAG: TetR/AcrR family transcriptional regulator [Myxococcota bacterium]
MPPAFPSSAPFDRSPAPARKGERTAERILDAAEALFAEKGYEGTALRDVAAAVGIRTPSLYNHFDGKDRLYAAVLDRGFGPVLALLDRVIEAPPAERPGPGEMIETVMRLLAAHPHLPRLLLHETLAGGQRMTPALRERLAPMFAKAFATVEAADEQARFAKREIPLVVLALFHAVVGYHTIAPLYRELVGDDLLADDARADQTRFLTELTESLFARRNP